eukprot:g14520.t1 g14520  g14520.t2 contig9:2029801-2030732(+)
MYFSSLSFNRSVNGWGFKRLLRVGPDNKEYYHECFLRGRSDLTKLITRLVASPGKRLPNLKDEPNFFDTFKYSPLPLSDPTVFNHNRPAFPSAPLTTNNNWYPQTHGNSFQNHYPYDPTATHQVQVSQMTSHHNLNLTQNQVQYYPTVPVGLPPYQHIYDNAFRSPSNHSLLDRYNGSVDPTLVHRGILKRYQ